MPEAVMEAPRKIAAKKDNNIVIYELHSAYRQRSKGVTAVQLDATSKKMKPDSEQVPIKEEMPHYFLIPSTDVVVMKDKEGNLVPKTIRYIKGCALIDKEEQDKAGYKPTRDDRIEIIDGALFVDKVREVGKYNYIEHSNRLEQNELRSNDIPPHLTRVNRDDQHINSNKAAYQYAEALGIVQDLTENDAYDLLLLRGWVRDPLIELEGMKSLLINIAQKDPAFIINGIHNRQQRRKVLVRKAVEKGFISLVTPGSASWLKEGMPASEIVRIGDIGGEEGKLERFITFLTTDDGQVVEERLLKLVGDIPVRDLGEDMISDEEEQTEETNSFTPKRGRPKKQ